MSGRTGDAVYICEDVANIEFRDGLFYLDFGAFQCAMRPFTFLRCTKGAGKLAKEWERQQAKRNVVRLR